jgi:ABC-type amino acid transport system permease subunit
MPMQVYLITGAMYFIMAYPLSRGVRRLERMAGKGRRIEAGQMYGK